MEATDNSSDINEVKDSQEIFDSYMETADKFYLSEDYFRAGEFYTLAATLYEEKIVTDQVFLGEIYAKAANCYKSNPDLYVFYMLKAVKSYLEDKRFLLAAKHLDLTGDYIDQGASQLSHDVPSLYKSASLLYSLEGMDSMSRSCQLKAAPILALRGDYGDATEIYEKVGIEDTGHRLHKYVAKNNFLMACICQICSKNLTKAGELLQKFTEVDCSFVGTQEHNFVKDLMDSVAENNETKFFQAFSDFKYPKDNNLTLLIGRIRSFLVETD